MGGFSEGPSTRTSTVLCTVVGLRMTRHDLVAVVAAGAKADPADTAVASRVAARVRCMVDRFGQFDDSKLFQVVSVVGRFGFPFRLMAV